MICASTTEILAENATPPAPASTGKKPKRGGVGDGPPSPTGRFFFKMPSLSDETKRAITKASAWPAFVGICDAIRDQQRRGKTDRIRQLASEGKIGIGINGLCRMMGFSRKTANAQLARLEKLELAHVHRPPPVMKADPITGRIKEKQGGRSKRAVIYLTIQDSHLRPMSKDRIDPYSDDAPDMAERSKGQSEPHNGVQSDTPPARYKGKSEPPSKEYPNKYQRRRQPPASGEPGGGSRLGQQPEPREPQPFTGPDADAFAYTRAKLEREASQREAEAAEREAASMNPATVRAADAATPAAKPPDSIREGKLCEKQRPAAPLRPQPAQATKPPTAADRAAFDVLNDTPDEVVRSKQHKAFISRKEILLQQCALNITASRVSKPESEPERRSIIAKAFGWVSRAQAS